MLSQCNNPLRTGAGTLAGYPACLRGGSMKETRMSSKPGTFAAICTSVRHGDVMKLKSLAIGRNGLGPAGLPCRLRRKPRSSGGIR